MLFASTASAQVGGGGPPADGPFLPKHPNEPPSTGRYAEPEFVPYVNDLQIFDQPDLSPYGQGPRPAEGWFGSAEFLKWSIQSPDKTTIGTPTVEQVFAPGSRTVDSGDFVGGVGNVAPAGLNTGSPSAPGVTSGTFLPGSGVAQISTLDTGFIESEFTTGGRFEFGRINNDRGWMVSSFNLATQVQDYVGSDVSINFENQPRGFVDVQSGFPTAVIIGPGNIAFFQGDGWDDDLDGDGVFGRHGRDRGTRSGANFTDPLDGIPDPEAIINGPVPIDFDDAVTLPTVFRNFTVENRTNVWGVEAMRMWRLGLGPRGGVWELFVGPRYVNIQDQFNVDGRGPNTNPQYYLNPLADSFWNTGSENNVLAAQFGGRWAIQRDRVQFSVETRLFAGANFQSVRQFGQFASLYGSVVPTTGGAANFTVPVRDDVINGQLPHAFQSSFSSAQFTPGGELRFNLKYQVFRSLYLQLGYTAFYATNIARASNMVRYSFPDMGILQDRNRENFFMNGVDFGVVINR